MAQPLELVAEQEAVHARECGRNLCSLQCPSSSARLSRQIGAFRYEPKAKPALLILLSGDVIEFNSIDRAEAYLRSARNAAMAGSEEAMTYYFQDNRWPRIQ